MAPPLSKKIRRSLPLPPSSQALAATFRQSSRPPTAASLAAAAAAQKKNDALQLGIAFDVKEKCPPGLKVLLDESVYDDPDDVSFFNFFVCFFFLNC